MSVSPGTIFVLNSVALLAFPAIGTWLRLSQSQFEWWAAPAMHDTSSVVGASARYGLVALAVGTTVSWYAPCGSFLCRWPQPRSKAARRRSNGRGSSSFSASQPWRTPMCYRSAYLQISKPSGKDDADLHVVLDWSEPVTGSAAQGWSPSPAARRNVVDHGGGCQLACHSRRVDQDLRNVGRPESSAGAGYAKLSWPARAEVPRVSSP